MIDWSAFTPTHALAGGALIGLAAMVLWLGSGRIAGISGIVGGLLGPGSDDDRAWRWLFVGGLIGGAAIAHLVSGGLFEPRQDYSWWLLLPGAFLVGLGTRMARAAPAATASAASRVFRFVASQPPSHSSPRPWPRCSSCAI